MDVVLLGLPHKVSAGTVPKIIGSGARIVDLSGDFRLQGRGRLREVLRRGPPGAASCSQRPCYGLPELNREAIRRAKYVASPGCFATTIELGLLPLAEAGLLDGAVETVGITGSSGSGIAPARRHAPPGAREQPEDVQAARSPAHPGDRADARRRAAPRASRSASCR